MKSKHISLKISIFHGRSTPEEGLLVGYGALIEAYALPIPLPNRLMLISTKKRQYKTEQWQVFTSRYEPEDTLYKHLVFAIKYEGINLLFFKKLFEKLRKKDVEALVQIEPQGQYSRKIWFLYEWLLGTKLNIPNLATGNSVLLIDEKIQYASNLYTNSSRHRIKNNLPGTVAFCPLVYKTEKLENFIHENLSLKINEVISGVHKDILLRTSAFLLLKDSKASFTIEGETPTQNRAVRWGRAIGQAGSKPLCKDEFLRLQQIVIENSKFIKMGYRTEGGFVGEHDRSSGDPIPEHISARWQDVESLMGGLIESAKLMEGNSFHPVLTAAKVSFGFVFIHPFVDGNGRLHRYLIHHLLSAMKFAQQGIIFPVSSAILERINDYKNILEIYSHPLLDFIEWKKTKNNNIEVLNETIDYYRYFDATAQAEFLFECVEYTINKIIPVEVYYLQKFDRMKAWLDDRYQMPDKMVSMLIRFLEQNNGSLSKRVRENEFAKLTDKDAKKIEAKYKDIFLTNE